MPSPKRYGSMSIAMKNGAELKREIEKLEKNSEKAIAYTISDARRLAPGWVRESVKKHYNVDNSGLKSVDVKIEETTDSLEGIKIRYKGRLLTFKHFSLTPKSAPKKRTRSRDLIPGQAIKMKMKERPVGTIRQPKPYGVTVEIIAGQRKKLNSRTFVYKGIAWCREPGMQRWEKKSVSVLRGPSVPQMIDGKAHDTVMKTIDENLDKRFRNQCKRFLGQE
ncbi:MAG: hypothetical protein Q4D76_09970 [Oscillospiraceae bacterium]|nr:hypothetical protein [Oscillospiraceae bacterium]